MTRKNQTVEEQVEVVAEELNPCEAVRKYFQAAIEQIVGTDTVQTRIANITAVYDSQHNRHFDNRGDVEGFDAEQLVNESVAFVTERFAAALAREIHQGIAYGLKETDKAQRQLAAAIAQDSDETTRGQKSQNWLVSRETWALRQDVQMIVREALQPWAEAVYQDVTGAGYVHNVGTKQAPKQTDEYARFQQMRRSM